MDGARSDSLVRPIRIISAILVIGLLYFARDVLIPASLAILLTFLLHPIVVRLVRWKLNRGVAVGITVIVAAGMATGVGYLVGHQFVVLSDKLPQYQGNLKSKVQSFRSHDGTFAKLQDTIQDFKKEIATSQPTTATTSAVQTPAPIAREAASLTKPVQPMQVEVVNDGPNVLNLIATFAPPILVPISEGAIVLLLLIFLLLHSEDVRERLVWFAGMRQISITTAALDDAGQRISGYLRMLSMVNFAYGIMIAICLAILGLPTAFFWGALAAVLRFVPFLGPWVAAILPTLLGIAVFEGWRGPIEIVCAFIIVELITNMLLEPWLYGRSTGISSLGVVFAAVFWAWLWGPVGLILSVPLTVCLLVIGKQVPQLAVLNQMFGENAEMPKPVRLYQRVLVGDDLTAGRMIDKELKAAPFPEVVDSLFMPVLQELKRDLNSEMIDIGQVRRAIAILDVAANAEATPEINTKHPPLLFVAGQNEVDDMAATLLVRASIAEGVGAEMVSSRSLASEAAERARELAVTTLFVVQVAPISWTHCRHLSKTLSARLPTTTIYAANIEPADIEAPFTANTGQLPAKKLYRDVKSLMARLRELRFIEPEVQPAPAA